MQKNRRTKYIIFQSVNFITARCVGFIILKNTIDELQLTNIWKRLFDLAFSKEFLSLESF